jgi:hypothetical protein
MAEQHEVRIVKDGAKVRLVHPPTGQTVDTGLKVTGDRQAQEQQVARVAEQLKRSGHKVTYREV